MSLEMFIDEVIQKVAMKICTKCREAKPATSEYFWRQGGRNDGWNCWCKECSNVWYHNGGKEKHRNQEHNSPHRSAFRKLRGRVKRVGKYKFLLGEAKTPEAEAYIEYLKTITHCPDCAKELVWFSEGMGNPDSASFDRIDSDEDYTKENVRIVCFHCNKRKQDSPVDEWIGLLKVRIEKGIIERVDECLLNFLSEMRVSL